MQLTWIEIHTNLLGTVGTGGVTPFLQSDILSPRFVTERRNASGRSEARIQVRDSPEGLRPAAKMIVEFCRGVEISTAGGVLSRLYTVPIIPPSPLFCRMILDSLQNAEHSCPLHPGFRAAFDYLRTADLASLPAGKHAIDGDRLYVMMNVAPGRGEEGVKFEAHRKYIDIQYTVTGPDRIGWSPLPNCKTVDTPYDGDKDFLLFSDRPEAWIEVPAGSFAIFFPNDAHAPMGAPVGLPLRKAVVKVAVDWK